MGLFFFHIHWRQNVFENVLFVGTAVRMSQCHSAENTQSVVNMLHLKS